MPRGVPLPASRRSARYRVPRPLSEAPLRVCRALREFVGECPVRQEIIADQYFCMVSVKELNRSATRSEATGPQAPASVMHLRRWAGSPRERRVIGLEAPMIEKDGTGSYDGAVYVSASGTRKPSDEPGNSRDSDGHRDRTADARGDLGERHQFHTVGSGQDRYVAGTALATVAGVHDCRFDWVEINPAADNEAGAHDGSDGRDDGDQDLWPQRRNQSVPRRQGNADRE